MRSARTPPQPRPRNPRNPGNKTAIRLALLLLLFIAAGAIVNVAVAWGCSCWSEVSFKDRPWQVIAWQAPVPADWPNRATHWYAHGFGISQFDALGDPPVGAGYHIRRTAQWVLQAGWPIRAFFLERHRAEEQNRVYMPLSVQPLSHKRSDWWSDGIAISPQVSCSLNRRLPTRVLWPGFAINTIFYAAVLWIVFAAPGTVKRMRRRKKGRCIHCGYDLRGHVPGATPEGKSIKCPECGRIAFDH